MSKTIDLTGQVFNRLTVMKQTGINNHGDSTWLCKCNCGKETIVAGYRLRNGKTQSCGCLNKEITRNRSLTHGKSKEKIYFVWKAMINRCTNNKNHNYKDYGGRGIKVCTEWMNINNFIKWANSNGYKEGLEIDRINNDGNYEPSNCRWTTRKVQTNNCRRNIVVNIEGVSKTLKQWAEYSNLNVNTLQYRYYRGDRGKKLIRPVKGVVK